MAEPSVQVPVSLIEAVYDCSDDGIVLPRIYVEQLRALLSQPTPTAEPCPECLYVEGHRDDCGRLDDYLAHRDDPAPPTREQIAEAICSQFDPEAHDLSECQSAANAVMLLFAGDDLRPPGTSPATPPRIADMVPGTCSECHRPYRLEEDSEFHLGLVCSECGSLLLPIGARFIGQEQAGDLNPLIFTISRRGTATISEPSVMGWAASSIDPSTIRDVAPPSTESTK